MRTTAICDSPIADRTFVLTAAACKQTFTQRAHAKRRIPTESTTFLQNWNFIIPLTEAHAVRCNWPKDSLVLEILWPGRQFDAGSPARRRVIFTQVVILFAVDVTLQSTCLRAPRNEKHMADATDVGEVQPSGSCQEVARSENSRGERIPPSESGYVDCDCAISLPATLVLCLPCRRNKLPRK